MSNGQNNAAPAQELTIQLHSLLANQVFTDAHHASVVEHIRRARAMLDNVEQEAHNRHGMYQNAVKALQDRIVAGQQAQQMLARLGAQVPPNVPLIDSVNGFPPAQAPSVTIQQSTQRQPPYPILTTANGSEIPRAGPSQHSTPGSHAPQQPQHFSPVSNPPPPPPHFSPVSYAPKPKTPTGYQSIPTQWQPYNHQQPIPPQQHASQAQTSSRTSGPQMTANDPQRHYREFITPRAPPQAQTANGTFTQHQLAVPQQPQTAQNRPAVSPHLAHSRPAMLPPSAQSRSAMLPPSAQSPSAPTPQSAARGATTHSSGGVSSASPVLPTSPQIFGLQAGQNARAGTSHTLQSSQNPSKTATPSDVAVEVHNVLKSLRIDIIQTIIRLCMQTLHRMSRLSLTPREVQIVNATQVDAQRANDVNIVVSILVQKLQHLTSSEIMTILRTAMRVQRLPDILPNTNVQRLPPSSPAVPGSSVTTVADNARTKPPSSSTESTVITNHPSLATPLISTQPISYPSSLSVPRVPDPATSSPIDSSKSKMGHIGGTFGSFRVDGTLDASHPAHQSTNRSAYTVLNTPSASQASQARHTPPLSPGGALLSPNTKTLARDILRSLGRRTDSSGTNSSSVGIVAKSPALNEHQPPSAPQEQHEQLPTATSNATSGPNQQKSAERELIVIADDSSTSPQPGGAEEATTNGDIAAKQRPQLQPLLVDEPEDPLPDVHDVEEIQTPGVIQMAYEEVQQMLQGQPSAPVLVEDVAGPAVPLVPASPILKTTSVEEILQSISIPQVSTASLDDLAPAVPLAPTSPIMSSAATPPPTSRSSTPVEPEAKISTPTPQPAPVAGPSKEPLFLASPSTSSVSVENHMMADNAGSEGGTDAFIPTGLLDLSPSQPAPPAYKGKGRGLDSDSEEGNMDMAHLNSSSRPFKRRKVEHTAGDTEVVETSEPEERAADRPRRTRVKLEVVVPPLPELFQRAEASRLSSPWGTRTRPLVVLSGSSSPVMAVDGDNEIEKQKVERQQRLFEERIAVELSASRLHETLCCWRGCDAILESAVRLGKHAQLHALEKESVPFMCEWEDCGRRFPTQEMLATHLYRHSENFMICAYDGCEHIALMPNELVFHHKGHDGQPLKPTAVSLFKRTCPSPPPLPQVLPAYMTVPLRVAPAPISRDLHVWIGSKIAANITCYIHPGSRANAAAPSRATRRLAEKVALVEREAQKAGKDPTQAILHMSHGEYDSWIPYHSQRGPKYCDDLPASEVTAMVASGLVIGPEYLAGDRPWPPKGAANIDGEDGIDELDSPFEDIVNESDKTVVVEDAETSHDATARTNEAIKVDEVAVVTGTEMQIEPALSTIHSQVSSQSLGLPAPVPASDGEQQESDRGHDERAAESETLSQTGWALLREDSADVNDML